MILDAEHGPPLVAQPLDGLVVKVDVRDLDVIGHRLRVNGEAVVLRCDLDLLGGQALHGVVATSMTELQLVGLGPHGQPQHLMPEADAEDRHVSLDQLPGIGDRVVQWRRVARTVAEKDPRPVRSPATPGRTSEPGRPTRGSRTP